MTTSVAIAIVAVGLAVIAPAQTGRPPGEGRQVVTVTDKGVERRAELSVPASYRAGAPLPLVILLHGAGGSGANMLDGNRWDAKAAAEGFIVVAPDGVPSRPEPANFRTNPRVWNSGQLRAANPRARIDDVAFLDRLVNEVAQRVAVDRQRLYLAGHSNGAGMAFRAAAERPDTFAAIALMAGRLAVTTTLSRPVPTLYMIGTEDPLVPIAGGSVQLPFGGPPQKMEPVSAIVEGWRRANGLGESPIDDATSRGVRVVSYGRSEKTPLFVVHYVIGHGHAWAGGKGSGLPDAVMGPNVNAYNATDQAWAFLRSHRR